MISGSRRISRQGLLQLPAVYSAAAVWPATAGGDAASAGAAWIRRTAAGVAGGPAAELGAGVWLSGAPPPQYWHPDGFVGGRGGGFQGYRLECSVTKCYGCGVLGHYNKDNRCLPGAREAYQAIQASMQARQQGQQLALTGPGATGN